MTPPGTLDGREPTFDLARISRPRISLARRFALLRCIARPPARAQPHHVASYTPLGPKKQAQVPVWLVRSIRSSTGLIRANLSYLVKMAIFAPSVGPRAGVWQQPTAAPGILGCLSVQTTPPGALGDRELT